MPVDLKQIPKAEPLTAPPDKSRWLIVIILLMIVGSVLVLSLWPKELSTHSVWFWFCVLIAPFAAGLTGYIVRLRHYENQRDRVLWWNHLYQKQYDEQILYGQQAVGVLGISYTTPIASNKLAVALLRGGNVLQTQYSPVLQKVLTTASLLSPLTNINPAEYQERLKSVLGSVIRQLDTELTQFTDNLIVRLHHDGVLENGQVIAAWQAICPTSYNVNGVSASTENNGFMWIDEWLDKKDDALLLSIEINLFMHPRDRQNPYPPYYWLHLPGWKGKV